MTARELLDQAQRELLALRATLDALEVATGQTFEVTNTVSVAYAELEDARDDLLGADADEAEAGEL
jgi:hypothetical protein